MTTTIIPVGKNIRRDIDNAFPAITAGLAQLVDRYKSRKSKMLTGDEKKLLLIVKEEINVILTALTSLGIRIKAERGTPSIAYALSSAVEANNVWNEIKNAGEIDAEPLEIIVKLLQTTKTTINFSVSGGMWQ
ncbi:hypothetical protein HY485_02500 [Candidatus Woesearchaeota archaeon]|nr:hypothetical protein [Candidatus Woesearchaeota archaeon]